jgi:hydroxypyruvate reductase/glycerate 2-kinase
MQNRDKAEQIFISGVRSVLPDRLITNHISIKGSVLKIDDLNFSLEDIRNIYVIGAGNASAAMAHYVETILGDRITEGHIVVKYRHSCKLKKIKVTEAGHPIPDLNGFRATEDILRIANQATENDLVICLISGGGSALMADLPEGCLPEELFIVNNLLIRCGASINEINIVRKHLSKVKGGQLSRAVWPGTLVSLIISDVIGNPLDVIASGPTVPDNSTFGEALKILENYQIINDITAGIKNYLKEGVQGLRSETPKPGDPVFAKTFNILAGTNLFALEAAKNRAVDFGFNTFIIDSKMHGDVIKVSQTIVDTALDYKNNTELRKPVCLLYGGETTIKITGAGLGGRNQHLALSTAIKLQNKPGIIVLSAGTDGTDGTTNVTGAVVDSDTILHALSGNLDPEKYLKEFDSYNFFKTTGGHVITGPTFTNVMDMVIVLVE